MKIFQINSVNYGSTGKIMFSIAELAQAKGHTVMTSAGFTKRRNTKPYHFITSGIFTKLLHTYLARLTGLNGCFSVFPTLLLLARLRRFKPDIIHCHNLHGWYLNLPLFFSYLKKARIPVVWTLHDCWAFTGQCPHFTMVGCDKWKSGCHDCPQLRSYPKTYVDRSRFMWKLKRRCFTGVENMTLVTPSKWLSGLVKQSFLKDYPVKVINNGIDLDIFKPRESSFRLDHGIAPDDCMLLGVAFDWGARKGLDVFIELAGRLPSNFKIVLVGTDDAVDRLLPENIISIHQTENQAQLAEIYSAADLFVNPTREEVFGLVNAEALACGTPVITFNTGGCPEIIDDSCGTVVDTDDVAAMFREIVSFCAENRFELAALRSRAAEFSKDSTLSSYIDLYLQMYNSGL